MLYDLYKNEEEFRKKFVRPLLTRLGFVAVAELHGSQEFGKDFVFSELTQFGFLRHYAAVVKHKRSINQKGLNCQEILSQVKQAFSIKFQLPDNESENKISSVVVFNSGKITENGRKWLRAELEEEKYGRNVHILDGERLYQLDWVSTFHQTEQLLPRLKGMQNNIYMNIQVLKKIYEERPDFRGTFTLALEEYLAAPFLTERVNTEVSLFVQECRIIERMNIGTLWEPHRKFEIKTLRL